MAGDRVILSSVAHWCDWHLGTFPFDETQCKPMVLFVTDNLLSTLTRYTQPNNLHYSYLIFSTLSESTAQSTTNQPKSLLICFYRYWYCLKTFWNNVIEIIPYSPEPIQRLYTANLMWHAISVSQTIASPQVPVFNEQPFGCEPVCVSVTVCVCNQRARKSLEIGNEWTGNIRAEKKTQARALWGDIAGNQWLHRANSAWNHTG